MSGQNRILVGILIVIWIAFGFWQMANREILQDAPEGIVRLDLVLVLPALVIITILLFLMIKNDIHKASPGKRGDKE